MTQAQLEVGRHYAIVIKTRGRQTTRFASRCTESSENAATLMSPLGDLFNVRLVDGRWRDGSKALDIIAL